MDLKRKLEIFKSALDSIATHSDADSVVILAALKKADEKVQESIKNVTSKAQAQAEKAFG
jgi:hypothetical protein